MNSEVEMKPASLYDTDYQLWLAQTVVQLKSCEFGNLDLENLIEEIESLGKRDQRALVSYLIRLCEHLLKIKYWESERKLCFRGWVSEINNFRSEIGLILQDSPSLRSFLDDKFPSSYQKARTNLLRAMQLSADSMSEVPIFTIEQALDEDWLPWQPEP